MFTKKLFDSLLNIKRQFSTSSSKYDLLVLGAGPGGYTMAIKAAQHGLKVGVVEKRPTLGGTCLNCGCIPSKSLLNTSHLYHLMKKGVNGLRITGLETDVGKMMEEKDSVMRTLNMGIFGLFKKNKIDYIQGTACFKSQNEVTVGSKVLLADKVVVATGSEVRPFPSESLKVDGKYFLSSTETLCLDKVPNRLLVIGAGAIGLELASVWSRLGSKVDIFEFNNQICSVMDTDVCVTMRKILEKQGLNIHTGTKVLNAKVTNNTVTLTTESEGKEMSYVGDKVLVAMGRVPYTEGLGIDKLGVTLDYGKVPTDNNLRVLKDPKDPNSVVENVYAIGDVTYGPMLAHKAEEDGLIALGHILGKSFVHHPQGVTLGSVQVVPNVIPSVIYTEPEIAGVGETEQNLQKLGVKYKKSVFPFMANSRAKIYNESDGFIKLLSTEENKLLGAWMIGPHVSEMIHTTALAITYGASSEDVTRMCFAHPSLSEAIKESSLGIHFKPLHF